MRLTMKGKLPARDGRAKRWFSSLRRTHRELHYEMSLPDWKRGVVVGHFNVADLVSVGGRSRGPFLQHYELLIAV